MDGDLATPGAGGPPDEPARGRPTRTRRRRAALLAVAAVALAALAALAGLTYRGGTGPSSPAASSSPGPAPAPAPSTGGPAGTGGPVVVAAVGDSNTFGHGVVAASESYPAQLQDLLGDGYEVLNFGVSSRSLLSTARWPYTAEPRYEESLRSEPDVVLVMLGTNDAKDVRWDPRRYRTELVDLVETYRALPSAPRVYLLTVPAAFANTRGVPPDRIATQVVPIIRDVAETTGAPLVDVYAATRDHGELFLDGIHPNATGFGIVAATVRDALVPR